MKVIHDAGGLAEFHGGAFVPMMGALHEGHLRAECEGRWSLPGRVGGTPALRSAAVVSIFVNPTQFNDPKDLERYPRTLGADLDGCERAGADAVFVPSVETMYPPRVVIPTPRLPAVATEPKLEDAHRPGHFAGVCQVVKRLFELVRPAAAVLGEKDWQQLQVITAMTAQEGMGIQIVPGRTVREPDGLAMSSRNRFLSAAERRSATALSAALAAARDEPNAAAAMATMESTTAQAPRDLRSSTRSCATRGPWCRHPSSARKRIRYGH